ncbi:MAG TPA: WecB/TagA/CpsF family glycosyltransferase [Acidothermaceae bacterium]|jgi:N-acetylglucosaminyldiphosphoundecaprenol N-acetyl-beta-D-mannosaminyltransferase|nr:WecB/TagA/CpsF family glycosyltransferase [Acidothermaceae bacterium]
MSPSEPARFDVLGVGISAVSLAGAASQIESWLHEGERHYVCVTNVHTVMECQRDPELMRIHNVSGMTTPDGMPIVWCGKWAGAAGITRVYGPDLMLELCARLANSEHSAFFYGTTNDTLERLQKRLTKDFPGLRIAGTYAPPFRPLTPTEDAEVAALINASGADVVWVGLGAPKQERWMADHQDLLTAKVLIGVGAAFDFHAGTVRQAPLWMQRHGLEWLFRLFREPRRLWRRYLRTNPAFVFAILRHRPRMRPSAS